MQVLQKVYFHRNEVAINPRKSLVHHQNMKLLEQKHFKKLSNANQCCGLSEETADCMVILPHLPLFGSLGESTSCSN